MATLCFHLAGEPRVSQLLETYLDVFTHHNLNARRQWPVDWEEAAHQRLRSLSGPVRASA